MPAKKKSENSPDTNHAKAQARHVADRKLREAHQTEWNGIFQAELKARGIEWSPKPTQEQLDLAKLAELVAAYPEEAGELANRALTVGADDDELAEIAAER